MIALRRPLRVCYVAGIIRAGVRVVVASRCGKAPAPVAPVAPTLQTARAS